MRLRPSAKATSQPPDQERAVASAVSILIADDHEVVRRALCRLLETQAGWTTIEAQNGHEAVHNADKARPDIVIMDIDMPQLNGLDAAYQIHQQHPSMPILLLSAYSYAHMIHRAIKAGVRGYVLKTDTTNDLIAGVNTLLQGKDFFAPEISRWLLEELPTAGKHGPRHLTLREIEVVQLLGDGKSNKEVADALGISTRTVEQHRAHMMRRFGFRSFTELLRYAIRNRIVQP